MTNQQHKLTTIPAACLLILAFIGAIVGTAHGQTNQEKAVQANALAKEASQLIHQGTAESLREAESKFSSAQKLFHELGDKSSEAACFCFWEELMLL